MEKRENNATSCVTSFCRRRAVTQKRGRTRGTVIVAAASQNQAASDQEIKVDGMKYFSILGCVFCIVAHFVPRTILL